MNICRTPSSPLWTNMNIFKTTPLPLPCSRSLWTPPKTGGNLVRLVTPHRWCKFLNIFSWNRHNSMADTRRGGWLLVSPMNIIGGILTLVTLNERLRSKSWKVLWCTFRFPWFIIGTTTRTKSGHKLCKKGEQNWL